MKAKDVCMIAGGALALNVLLGALVRFLVLGIPMLGGMWAHMSFRMQFFLGVAVNALTLTGCVFIVARIHSREQSQSARQQKESERPAQHQRGG